MEEITTISKREILKQKIVDSKNNWIGSLTKTERIYFIESTSFLPENVSMAERRYYFVNNLTEIIRCPVCGNKVGFWNNKHRPYHFCSEECRNSKKGKEISYTKFSNKWKAKTKEEIKEITNKRSNTLLKTFGVTHPSKSIEIRNKQIKKMRKEYGVDYYFQSEEFKERNKQINYEHLNVEFPTQNKEVQEKCLSNRRRHHYSTFVENLKNKFIEPLFTMEGYASARDGNSLMFKCLKCGENFEYKLIGTNIISHTYINCPNTIHKTTSCYETEIYEWLKSHNIKNIERNKRKWKSRKRKFEADIFLSDYNLVVEFNGIYWHCGLYKDLKCHFNKWKFFKEQNIDCIQIFENEWILKKDIVKDIILKKLSKVENRINANDCSLRELNDEEYKLFVEQNWIKGYEEVDVTVGLFYNDELIQCLGLKKEENEWIIICDCSKLNWIVENGTEKLLNGFKGNIIFYADCRYFNGKEYDEIGFKFKEHTEPNYFYFKSNQIDLIKSNQICDLERKNYLCICDCGYDVFSYNNHLNTK